MTDSDVEMLSEQFATMSATTYTTIDWAFHEIAENDDEYRRWHDQVHTCFCRSEDCVSCAVRDCEHHDPYHYHHDGCPSCNTQPLWRGVRAGQVRREECITIVELIWD